jgi:hypothetical protein
MYCTRIAVAGEVVGGISGDVNEEGGEFMRKNDGGKEES